MRPVLQPSKVEERGSSGWNSAAPAPARCPPSTADPTILAGEYVDREDDVLFVKSLPHFDKRINEQDSEVLISYLTAPYIRCAGRSSNLRRFELPDLHRLDPLSSIVTCPLAGFPWCCNSLRTRLGLLP